MKKVGFFIFIFLFSCKLTFAQATVVNSGILTNFDVNYTGTGTGGGCDNGCDTYNDIGAPYNTYIINTSSTATVNAASGAGILCDNTYATGNHTQTSATATYTLASTCTYTIISLFGWGTGSCPDSRADAGDSFSLTQSGATTLSEGSDVTPGSCGPTHTSTATAVGCGNAVLTGTLVVQTGASAATVNISYNSNRADEVLAFQIIANSPTGCGVIILPINLIEFSAKKIVDNSVQITWATISEVNNHYFVLEYSYDAINFTPYKEILGAGNSYEKKEYKCLFSEDEGQSKTPFFRLKQVDYNGNFKYSNIITLGQYYILNGKENEFKAYYNSEREVIATEFTLDTLSQVDFRLYDVSGAEIYQSSSQFPVGANKFQIAPPQETGIYFLVYRSGNNAPIRKKIATYK